VINSCSQALEAVTLRVLDGVDYRSLERYYDELDPRDAIGDRLERAHDREIAEKQQRWLKAKELE
jgi:hypothetical protein